MSRSMRACELKFCDNINIHHFPSFFQGLKIKNSKKTNVKSAPEWLLKP